MQKNVPVSFIENDYDISEFDEVQVPQHIDWRDMIKFIISTPCIPGKDMNIADLAGTCNHIGRGDVQRSFL